MTSVGRFANLRATLAIFMACAAAAIALPAQTLKTLASFDGSNGVGPEYGALVQGLDGNLYGTTSQGGAYGCGTVFAMSTNGTLTTLYSFGVQFECTDGDSPLAGLVQGTDGNLYGTTNHGGSAHGGGTVFKITPQGTLTTLYNFCSQSNCADGVQPDAGLVQGTSGNFYGTTLGGGGYFGCPIGSCGTVFKIASEGTPTTLHSFDLTDGANPQAGLIQATNGDFYGTTLYGGTNSEGTLFRITASGTLKTLYAFCAQPNCTDGSVPQAGLVQGTNGILYGTTSGGGAYGYGTIFKITTSGALTILHDFDGTDGAYPYAGLIQATNGVLYGTTSEGGSSPRCTLTLGCGTVFRITTAGKLTTLHNFDGADGEYPYAGLAQATNGTLYGTTYQGGTNGDGTIFSLSVGLNPFVETLPAFGKVGAAINILGTDLTDATSVKINGASAMFTVMSPSQITTNVPIGATTTGTVQVIVPTGTLVSNAVFRVTPVVLNFSPTSGNVGTVVTITGNSLTGATSVTFGGVKATTFTVNSDAHITATVPTGAQTGRISVTTPGGTGTSAGTFHVY